MESPSLWQSLSDEERADSTGDLRKFHCCSKFAWAVKGKLQSDWNDRIQPQIVCLIRHNHKKVFGKSGVQVPWSLQLYLLSSANDPVTALPTIFLLTADKKAASNMRKLITRHDIFKNLNTGFDVLYESSSIFMRAGDCKVTGPLWSAESLSLCGAPVFVTTNLTRPILKSRKATVFCVVKIQQRHFAVLPAHVFEGDVSQHSTPSDFESVEDMSTSSDESSCDYSTDHISDDSGYQGSNETTNNNTEHPTINVPPKHAVYLAASKPSAEHLSPEDLKLMGYFDPEQQFSLCGLAYETTRELDYTLVEVRDSHWTKQNAVSISDTHHLPTETYKTKVLSESVLVATGSCGIQQARISGTAATMMLPESQEPQTVWELEYALGQGDSGSPVLNYDGDMLGMAVATIPDYNITYVIPAQTIFEKIYTSTHASEVSHPLDPSVVSQVCLRLNPAVINSSQSSSQKVEDLNSPGLDSLIPDTLKSRGFDAPAGSSFADKFADPRSIADKKIVDSDPLYVIRSRVMQKVREDEAAALSRVKKLGESLEPPKVKLGQPEATRPKEYRELIEQGERYRAQAELNYEAYSKATQMRTQCEAQLQLVTQELAITKSLESRERTYTNHLRKKINEIQSALDDCKSELQTSRLEISRLEHENERIEEECKEFDEREGKSKEKSRDDTNSVPGAAEGGSQNRRQSRYRLPVKITRMSEELEADERRVDEKQVHKKRAEEREKDRIRRQQEARAEIARRHQQAIQQVTDQVDK